MIHTPTTITTTLHDQRQTLLKIYTLYRVVLAFTLLVMFISSPLDPVVGKKAPQLFLYTALGYLAFSIGYGLIVFSTTQRAIGQPAFVSLMLDLSLLIVLSATSGGVQTGLPILFLVTICAAGMLFQRLYALFLAALGTIFILLETSYQVLYQTGSSNLYLPSGLFGTLLFAAALSINYLANRLQRSEELAEQQAQDVQTLQELTQQVVEQMRTGIVVVNHTGDIKMMNHSAKQLLCSGEETEAASLSPQLSASLAQWQQDHRAQPALQSINPESSLLHVRFSALDHHANSDVLLFIEDHSQLIQQAQQLKLASLGRLTASIAHEIRNPLGAISHAAQLLHESEDLSDGDLRLTQIIQNHSLRMNQIIENVLQLSRKQTTHAETVPLQEWVVQAITKFKESYPESTDIRVEDRIGTLTEITIDPAQMQQVFDNLAQNGLRYSQQATGRATLTLRLSLSSGDPLPQLDVIDDGEGVADEERETVFEPFYTTAPQGSGLGLYIARELCAANQAQLYCLRVDDNRNCFRISFSHPDKKPFS